MFSSGSWIWGELEGAHLKAHKTSLGLKNFKVHLKVFYREKEKAKKSCISKLKPEKSPK